jgi:hypothetical protein
MVKGLFVALLSFLLLCACSSQSQKATSQDEAIGSDKNYVYTVALNGFVYGFTNELVQAEQIENHIGEGQRVVSPKAEKNGDIGCSVSECAAPSGRSFYSIQNISQNDAIAVKVNETQYFKCIKISKL